jgi:hypothetical protein
MTPEKTTAPGRHAAPRRTRGTLRRIAPAVGLFLLAPLVAEFLLGNISISAFGAFVVLAPLYGGGALLIREVARRTGRGWPTILLLALAYALVEEGLVAQTLFNPSYFGTHLLGQAHVGVLGIGVWWALFVLTLHTVWSISVPIMLVESLVPDRRTRPWLGPTGLSVTALLLLLGAVLNGAVTYAQERFLASPAQLAGTAGVIAGVVAAAFRVRTGPAASDPRPAPSPWIVGLVALVASSVFLAPPYLRGWPLVAAYLVLYAVVIAVVLRWSRRTGWGPVHELALAGGALLTYAWHGFPERPVLGSTTTLDLVGNTVFATGAVVLLALAAQTVSRTGQRSDG